MSIAALNQVYDEMRRLSIAGGSLARGDFRLKKLVEPLKASAAKAPVFGKVAEAVEKVVDGPPKQSSTALLELSTLVTAVLYTQGETGAEGTMDSMPPSGFGMPSSDTNASVLKPLLEALTTTGSGREEIIKDAHQQGAFKDLRLVRPALTAIDDVYQPIADFMAHEILPMYGRAIYDDLEKQYDPKGKGGAVRRLALMHRLDPDRTRPHVGEALDKGSTDMRVAAIGCLKGSRASLPLLLDQAKSKSKDVRRAALCAMAEFQDDEVIQLFQKVLTSGDVEFFIDHLRGNLSPQLYALVHSQAEEALKAMLKAPPKKLAPAMCRFHQLLRFFAGRSDPQTLSFLGECFEKQQQIEQLNGEAVAPDYNSMQGYKINRRIIALLVNSNDPKMLKLIVDAHASMTAHNFDWVLIAGLRTRKPDAFYDLFSPYYQSRPKTEKERDKDQTPALRSLLMALRGAFYANDDGLYAPGENAYGEDVVKFQGVLPAIDPRWLDAVIATDDVYMVPYLAPRAHPGICAMLSRITDKLAKKKWGGDVGYEAGQLLEALIRVEHPKTVDYFLLLLKKAGSDKTGRYLYLAEQIPNLPLAAAAPIEKLLKSLSEKMVNQILPYVLQLKDKAPAEVA